MRAGSDSALDGGQVWQRELRCFIRIWIGVVRDQIWVLGVICFVVLMLFCNFFWYFLYDWLNSGFTTVTSGFCVLVYTLSYYSYNSSGTLL